VSGGDSVLISVNSMVLGNPPILRVGVSLAWQPLKDGRLDQQALEIDVDDVLNGFNGEQPGSIKKAGEQLITALCRHKEINEALDVTKRITPDEVCPIQFVMQSPNGARLPWEVLYDEAWFGFAELGRRWPISRRSGLSPSRGVAKAVAGRLRLMAVLSARPLPDAAVQNWDSAVEFKAIAQAIDDCDLPIDLHVLTSEQSVLSLAESRGVQAELITMKKPDKVMKEIGRFKPHILHFFCHGDETSLRLYKPADVDTRNPTLYISPQDLTSRQDPTFLVVLNCCSGAAETGEQERRSLTHLLTQADYPAVIGMREPVDYHDATRFSYALYYQLLSQFSSCQEEDAIDLRELLKLATPRTNILESYGGIPGAQQHRFWALPVLYLAPKQVEVPILTEPETPEGAARQEGEAGVVYGAQRFHPDTPGGARREIAQRASQLRGSGNQDQGTGGSMPGVESTSGTAVTPAVEEADTTQVEPSDEGSFAEDEASLSEAWTVQASAWDAQELALEDEDADEEQAAQTSNVEVQEQRRVMRAEG